MYHWSPRGNIETKTTRITANDRESDTARNASSEYEGYTASDTESDT
jgi:hypothetical protein